MDPDDVTFLIDGLEAIALGWAEEYGHEFTAIEDAVQWAVGFDGEAVCQYESYLRLKAAQESAA